MDDFVDAAGRYIDIFGQAVLGYFERFQELLIQDFARVNGFDFFHDFNGNRLFPLHRRCFLPI